jgi:hypothetical protein
VYDRRWIASAPGDRVTHPAVKSPATGAQPSLADTVGRVLRIGDTDPARNRPGWVDGILDAIVWLGIGRDEYTGPLFQSDYAGHHREAVGSPVCCWRTWSLT